MKKKMSALLAVMTVFMSAIMISALLANNTKSVDANEEQTVQYYNPTEVFISQIAESARQLGQENDLYASVIRLCISTSVVFNFLIHSFCIIFNS